MSTNNLIPAILFLVFFLFPVRAFGGEVTFAWDANTETDLAGYKVYSGTSSGNYTQSVDVGNTTEYTLTGLQDGVTYYFTSTAYDTAGNESGFSTEIVYTADPQNHSPDPPATPTGPSSGYVQINYNFSTSGSDPNGDLLQYRFDWGDGEISGWGGASSRTHAFSDTGNFCVKAQAKDSHEATSGWSQCLNISIVLQTHTITASAGANGSITPSGSVTVDNGASQAFSIIPNQNYHILDVQINGASVGAVSSYTFNSVTQDHTITASFTLDNQPPVANAGADQSVLVNDRVTLDGSGSSDADGDSLSFSWSFVSKPNGSSATLSDPTIVNPSFVADTPGSYTVQLIIHDGTVSSAPDTVTIYTPSLPPVAGAGADQNVREGQTVALDGTNSNDPDGSISYYQWVQTAGPAVSLSDSSAVQPQFLAPDVGTEGAILTFDLTVTDSQGITDTDSCNIIVLWQNQPPTADAGPDQTVESGKTVTLNGDNSTDKEDGIVSYQWVQTSGFSVSVSDPIAVRPTFLTPDVDLQGLSVEFELTVTDANGLTNTDSCIVNITQHNEPPIADAGANIVATPGQSIVLDGSGSHDIDDGIAAYQWTQIEGNAVALPDAQTPSAVFTAPEVGQDGESFTFVLTVVDQGGLKATDTCIVNVTWQNQPPLAVTNDYMETTEGLQIDLDGIQSTDSDDEIINYRWHQLEGPPVTFNDPELSKATFYAPKAERYGSNLVFALKVKDKGGLKDSSKCSVFVFPQNSPPVAADDVYRTTQGTQITISAPGILANDSDANGQTLSAALVSNPSNGSLTLNADGSFIYTPVDNFIGEDSFTYAANNGTMDSNTATVSIMVKPSTPISGLKMDVGITQGVNSSGWTVVTLSQSFVSPVVIATANYDNTSAPVVVRIQNASGNKFEVMVTSAGGTDPVNVDVHYMVVEEGVYTEAVDGVKMEAVIYDSTITGENNSWVGEARTYSNSYTSPVVLGQVMSCNDANFSTFWSQGNARANPPSATNLVTGKNAAEDSSPARANETVGYIVIEAGNGTINGVEYVAAVGADTVKGVTDTPPYSYAISGLTNVASAVATITAMDGGNGGWAILYGADPVSVSSINLAIDEDIAGDTERNHTTEQVAYIVFGDNGPVDNPPSVSITAPNDGVTINGIYTVIAEATDDNGIDSVTLSISGRTPETMDKVSDTTWEYVWYTTSETDGDHSLVATATDNAYQSTDSTAISVTVDNNDPPIANFSFTTSNLTATFTDQSSDSDGSIVSWNWDFGDGSTSTAQNPSHTYDGAGTYNVTLTVTDKDGDTGSDTNPVTVVEPSNGVIYVSSLDGISTKQFFRWRWKATVTINVSDAVMGAVVTGTWSDGVNGSSKCTTDGNGTCSVSYSRIHKKVPSVTFTITGIQSSLTYDPALNVVDSIIATKP